jgi:DNA-binding transcriptional LysR family regulator
MLDLHRLKIFNTIIEMKSFSKAARQLYLTQPTVSQHVNFLEEYLGVSLFDRLGKEVRPTHAGQILHTYALRLLRMADDAELAVAYYKGEKSGTFITGASNVPGEYILPEILGRFKEKYPGIVVRVYLGDTGGIVDKILNYEIDFGLIGARIAHDQLRCSRFIDDELCLILAPGHPWAKRRSIDVADLERAAFVVREPGSGTRMMVEQTLRKAGLQADQLSIIAELGSNAAVKQAVKAGLGISFVSKRSVVDEIGMNVIKTLPVKGLKMHRSFYIVRHKKRTLPPLVREFHQFLLAQR